MRRKNDDDNIGISLLNKRLNNEKLDDSLIDELMTTDEDRKRAEKEAVKRSAAEKKKAGEQSKVSSMVKNDTPVTNDNSSTPAEPVQTHPERPVQKTQIQPAVAKPFNQSMVEEPKYSNPVQDTYAEPQIHQARRIVGISDDNYDDENDENVIQNVINSTHNMFSSDEQINTPAGPRANTTRNTGQNIQSSQASATVQQEQTQPQIQYVEVPTPVYTRRRKKKSLASRIAGKLLTYAAYIAIIGAFLWIVTTYLIGSAKMNGNSMEPTYYDKETLIVDKISINFKSPERNDVIVFTKNETEYVARIVGVPGDRVAIDVNGKILVNDEYWDNTEETISQSILNVDKEEAVPAEKVSEIVLNKNEYYVISDNELAPMDSRNMAIGLVSKKDIYGIVLMSFDFNKD